MKRWEIEDAADKITAEAVASSATNLIPESSVLIVNRSGILKHTLPVGITRRSVAINQDLKALISNSRSHPSYIAHMVKAAEPIVLRWVRATTADNFPINNLRELEIPLPPLDEQRRIAAILDKADALRRKRKRALGLFDGLMQSIFLEMFGDPRVNERGWHMQPIGDLAVKIGSGATPRGGQSAYKLSGVTFVRSMNVRDEGFSAKGIAFLDDKQAKQLDGVALEKDDVLLNITGASVARVCLCPEDILPARVNQHVSIIRLNDVRLSRYVETALKTPSFKQFLLSTAETGATRQAITKTQVAELAVPAPPIKMIEVFNSAYLQTEKLQKNSKMTYERMSAVFSSLQARAFSGQL